MTIRTISQLPPHSGILPEGSLFEVSVPSGAKYISEKISSDILLQQFEKTISGDIAVDFGLVAGQKKYKVSNISAAVHQLSSQNCVLSGTKNFKDIPIITAPLTSYSIGAQGDRDLINQMVPNMMKVKDMIDDRACFIGGDYIVDGDPGDDEAPRFTSKSENFMYFRIDDNGVDSSKWIDPETRSEVGYEQCPHSGYLTMFGWLADNGNVLAQDAWVALYGQVYATQDDGSLVQKWIPLQVQPWPIGAKSSVRQYVSFSLPVREGLRLKVKTGFRVNGTEGAMQDSATKSFNLNEPNCFVGWILRPE